MSILRNKISNKMYLKTQLIEKVFNENVKFQQKLNDIVHKGSGNYTFRSNSVSANGSLNYGFRKQEATKIEQENLKLAKRIVGTKPAYLTKQLEKEFQKKVNKQRLLETKDTVIQQAAKRNFSSINPGNAIMAPQLSFLPQIGNQGTVDSSVADKQRSPASMFSYNKDNTTVYGTAKKGEPIQLSRNQSNETIRKGENE